MSDPHALRDSALVGMLVGGLAWIAGYLISYVIVSERLRDTALQEVIELIQGDPATFEMAGWVFFNMHFVDTAIRDLPVIGGHATNFIGGEDGFSALLYLVPIVLLLAGGLVTGYFSGTDDPTTGGAVGATLTLGYLLCTLVGIVVFEMMIAGVTIGPDTLAAILLAGLVYPIVAGGTGGVVGVLIARAGRPGR